MHQTKVNRQILAKNTRNRIAVCKISDHMEKKEIKITKRIYAFTRRSLRHLLLDFFKNDNIKILNPKCKAEKLASKNIFPTDFSGERNCILKWFFVQSILADQYIHCRELLSESPCTV